MGKRKLSSSSSQKKNKKGSYFGVSTKDVIMLKDFGKSCIFCGSCVNDEAKCGKLIHHEPSGLNMHLFCLLLSSGLQQKYQGEEMHVNNHPMHVEGFAIKDIAKEIRRGQKLKCSICKKKGATIGCVQSKCSGKFHHPCGRDHGVLSVFAGTFSSYCSAHKPRPDIYKALPEFSGILTEKNTNTDNTLKECFACMEKLIPPYNEGEVVVAACCKNMHAHKDCLQNHALHSGQHHFRCPHCNNQEVYKDSCVQMGIYLPEKDASWETESGAYQDLYRTHQHCDMENCKCPFGNNYHSTGTEWHIVKCDFCGSYGAHVGCHDELDSKDSFLCCPLDWKIYGGTKQQVYQAARKIGIFPSDQPETPSDELDNSDELLPETKCVENISSPIKVEVSKTKVHLKRKKRAKSKTLEINNEKVQRRRKRFYQPFLSSSSESESDKFTTQVTATPTAITRVLDDVRKISIDKKLVTSTYSNQKLSSVLSRSNVATTPHKRKFVTRFKRKTKNTSTTSVSKKSDSCSDVIVISDDDDVIVISSDED